MEELFERMIVWLVMIPTFAHARTITDMAGRHVTVPDRIERVAPFDNKTNVLLFALAGNKMIAKARAMENPHLKYISADFQRMKEVDMKNAEEVMRLHPDVLVVAAFTDDASSLQHYEAFASKLNIPLVVVDPDLMHMDKTFEFLGNFLQNQSEGKACADFIRTVYRDTERLKKGKRVAGKAYMANDNDGLRTVPASSSHGQLFEVLDIPNCVSVMPDAKGFAQVSVEQVLVWNPDYIFCVGKGDTGPYRQILKSAVWRNVSALRNKRVFYVPSQPYSWFDTPPSVNRIPGLIWFADLFYNQPNAVTKEKVIEFYHLFYHYNLSDKEYAALFKWQ